MRGRSENAVLLPGMIVLALAALWEGAVRFFDVKPYLLPAPSVIALSMVENWRLILANLQVTFTEMVIGFFAAALIAFMAGTAVSFSSTLRRALYPLIVASQTVPVIAIAPVLIIWFGYNIWPRVVVTALIAFFPLTVNVVAGFASVEAEHIIFFRSLGASRLAIFFKLCLPAALPYIFAGLRITAVLAVIGSTVGEWIGAERGLGHLITLGTAQLDTVRVFASIVVLSAVGISFFAAIVAVEWLVLPWRHAPCKASFRARMTQVFASLART